MKILFTGKGSSGSWQIRGIQIAEGLRAIGVDVVAIPKASLEQCRAADVIILVKRPTAELLDAIRASRKPFAWDVVDAWPQPDGNAWDAKRALTWLRTMVDHVRPNLLICATRDMLADAEYPSACVIYHHAKPEYQRGRANYFTVGYEGGQHYLGRYDESITDECRKRSLIWDRNSIQDACVAICLRDTIGYAPRHWKSQIKCENARALGIPALCSYESGYRETSSGGVIWIDSPEDLPSAFDRLANTEDYAKLSAEVPAALTIDQVSLQYLQALRSLC